MLLSIAQMIEHPVSSGSKNHDFFLENDQPIVSSPVKAHAS